MVFGFLRPGRVSLEVAWDQNRAYRPGDALPARVHVRMKGRPKLRGIRIGLVFWQRFRYPEEWEEENGTMDYRLMWKESERWAVQADLPLPSKLPSDFQQTFEGQLRIPDVLPPAHEGRICQARWYLKVVADRPMLPDEEYRAPVRLVVPPPGRYAEPGVFGEPSQPHLADLRFHLPGLEFVEGEVLEGQVVIRPHEDLEVRGVQVLLRVHERIPYDSVFDDAPDAEFWETVHQADLAGPGTLHAGREQRYAFRIPLPQGRPTCGHCGPGGRISWYLHARLDRALRRDPTVTQEIFLYNGR